MVIKKKKKIDDFKKEYANLTEFIEAIPEKMMIFKRDIDLHLKDSVNDKLIIIYEISDNRNTHFSERCIAYMRDKTSGKVRKVNQERLRIELGKILMKHFDKKTFMNDFIITLNPMELLEAYDRAVIRKGKVKHVEGCSKFLIHGVPGQPMQLMLRN